MTELAVIGNKRFSRQVVQSLQASKKGSIQKAVAEMEPLSYADGNIVVPSPSPYADQTDISRRDVARLTVIGIPATLTSGLSTSLITSSFLLAEGLSVADTLISIAAGFTVATTVAVATVLTTLFFSTEHLYKKAVNKKYSPEVKTWIRKQNITVSEKQLEELTLKIVGVENMHEHILDTSTGTNYYIHETTGGTARETVWKIDKVSKNNHTVQEKELPVTLNNTEADNMLETIKRKIATLQRFPLHPEDLDIIQDAITNMYTVAELAATLHKLGDKDYASYTIKALQAINNELNHVVHRQKQTIMSRINDNVMTRNHIATSSDTNKL